MYTAAADDDDGGVHSKLKEKTFFLLYFPLVRVSRTFTLFSLFVDFFLSSFPSTSFAAAAVVVAVAVAFFYLLLALRNA